MPIKSFRGQIANGNTETIPLHTNNGSTGYKIVKFEAMPRVPESATEEATMQIFTIAASAAAANNVVDFSDQTLIGVLFYFRYLKLIKNGNTQKIIRKLPNY